MPLSNRQLWYSDVLRAGLDTAILDEPDILTHATPAVLIGSLPKDVLVKLLAATLSTGAMSPEAVVQTANPDLLAEHVPPPVLWACFAAAVERAGIPGDGASSSGSREFLRRALDRALLHGVAAPKDVVEDVNAGVLGHCFPDALTTKLLEASLSAGRMTPELIVDTLGVDEIARYAPTKVVWSCLARTGAPQAGDRAAAAPQTVAAVAPPLAAPTTAPAIPPTPLISAPPAAIPPPPDAAATAAPAAAAAAPLPPPPDAAAAAAASVFDDEPSVYVEIDDASGTMEVTHEKEDPLVAALDDKKKGGARHTTRRA